MNEQAAQDSQTYDVVVVGGGPAGATVAHELAGEGRMVLLVDREERIKPCGGAIPPALIRDFAIDESLLVARIRSAQMIAPSERRVDMPIEDGFVGMVDREDFDAWLRERAVAAGAERRRAVFRTFERDPDGTPRLTFAVKEAGRREPETFSIRARCVVGADGARSAVGRQAVKGADKVRCVFAYHEIVDSPRETAAFDPERCDVYYQGRISPDFYGWIFPHGPRTSIGTGTARKGYGLRDAVTRLRATVGMEGCTTIRREGAPIPMKPLKRWDNGRDVVLAGDAAGVVAPASGEGIYYAMVSARRVGEAVLAFLESGDAKALATARRRFMREHGRVFRVLSILQAVWYRSDRQRERFVSICRDRDVQRLTWEAYMNKKLVRHQPFAHLRVFFKDVAHLLGLADGRGRTRQRSSG
ncbi:geranylgeranyl diphosphate reductase [Pararhizobium mangrovi]|uniref:geranylgeranyl diphosphate reductase n=1 Tax=Pararhizobium mangrovi TaxID=2590452 RepID=A0A506UCN2_9HYPH|nr:geranylgeranyl diphosphate reductase [Pararhizobium mangrovi]TPW30429.1 geranylgeranyl diphosphate reductase [Pararhizobium mangrovi]